MQFSPNPAFPQRSCCTGDVTAALLCPSCLIASPHQAMDEQFHNRVVFYWIKPLSLTTFQSWNSYGVEPLSDTSAALSSVEIIGVSQPKWTLWVSRCAHISPVNILLPIFVAQNLIHSSSSKYTSSMKPPLILHLEISSSSHSPLHFGIIYNAFISLKLVIL